MDEEQLIVQCAHCPVSIRHILVPPGMDPLPYLDVHIQTYHPTTAEPPWEEYEDYLVLSFGEAVEQDLLIAGFQR